MDVGPPQEQRDPAGVADAFVRFFGLSLRPTMDELTGLLQKAEIGTVLGAPLSGSLQGLHYSAPGGGYDIHYRENQWAGAQEHTVLHETYEIICETLGDLYPGLPPIWRRVPGGRPLRRGGADAAGGLRRLRRGHRPRRGCVAEAVRAGVCLGDVAAGRGDAKSAPHGGPVRAQGAGRAVLLGRVPCALAVPGRRGRTDAGVRGGGLPPAPRRVEQAGQGHSSVSAGGGAARCARRQGGYAEADGIAVAARPVFWLGRLAKVAVVAVPYRDRPCSVPSSPLPLSTVTSTRGAGSFMIRVRQRKILNGRERL